MAEAGAEESTSRVTAVDVAEELAHARDPDAAHAIKVAAFDLAYENSFQPADGPAGPYRLAVGITDTRLRLDLTTEDGAAAGNVGLAIAPLRRTIRDYGIVCDAYVDAIRTKTPQQIEAIDMGRRALHDEAGEMLVDQLAPGVEIDGATGRRLFTLVYALLRRR